MTGVGKGLPDGCRIVLDPPIGPAADLLAAAFADEPGMRWTCGAVPARRRAWFAATEQLLARQPGARRYLLELDGHPVAAAWTTSPGNRPPVTAQLAWLIRTLAGCGPRTMARTASYRRGEQPLVPPGASILEFVGVLTPFRGTGLGGVLLRRVLSGTLTGPGAGPVHLSTADPRNVQLYRRLRFEIDGTFALPGLQVTAMSLPCHRGG